MSLPKLSVTIHKAKLAISGKTISYRAFTVKEEKILLMAAESNTEEDLFLAFRQVINNCVLEELDVGKLPMFDLESVFVLLRAASVGEIAEFQIADSTDGETYPIKLNLTKLVKEASANVVIPDKKIMLSDSLGVIMKDITLDSFDADTLLNEHMNTEQAFRVLAGLVEKVFDEENVWVLSEYNDTEVLEFLESFTSDAIAKIYDYVNAVPRLRAEVKYKRKDGSENKVALQGLADFFRYA